MNVLITGGAGFVGSELGKFLLSRGCNVKILDNLEYGYRDNFEDNDSLAAGFVQADVRDENFVKYLDNVDVLYHFAGISSLPECESNPQKAYQVNTAAVANILNAVREKKIKRFIFASTSAVYENNPSTEIHNENHFVSPNLVYSTSKLCAEKICQSYAQNYGIDIIICRFFNVFGPHQDFKRKYPPFTSYLVREALAGVKPTIFNIEDCRRDYIYIGDLMEYLYLMAKSEKKYVADIFNLASGEAFNALDIAKTLYCILGKKLEYNIGDALNFWDKYGNLFDKEYNLLKERVQNEVFKHCLGDPTKIREEFGYIPKTLLKDGLLEVIKYQKKSI